MLLSRPPEVTTRPWKQPVVGRLAPGGRGRKLVAAARTRSGTAVVVDHLVPSGAAGGGTGTVDPAAGCGTGTVDPAVGGGTGTADPAAGSWAGGRGAGAVPTTTAR
ncbi:hypothetical protein GCM10027280_31860 [Micromonospora polyrhachis]